MKRTTKIVLFIALSLGSIAAESAVEWCCGNPGCIPEVNCKVK